MSYWSQKDNAYIVPDGNQQKFCLDLKDPDPYLLSYELTLNGDQLSWNHNDTIRVDSQANLSAGDSLKVQMNGEEVVFDPGTISSVRINPGEGHNNIQIASMPADVKVFVAGAFGSSDVVRVGSDAHSLAGIQGTVDVANTSGGTALVVDAAADGDRKVVLTDHSVSVAGLTPINYESTGVNKVSVYAGCSDQEIQIESTPAFTNFDLHPAWYEFVDYMPEVNDLIRGRSSTTIVSDDRINRAYFQ